MRLRPFVFLAGLAIASAHCASESPPDPPAKEPHSRFPGALVLTSPERAAFIEGGKDGVVEVRGKGASPELTVNGVKAIVADDGSFEATITPTPGLNLVVAVDGEASLESPFLYGHFESMDKGVPQAIAVDIGVQGLSGVAPAASLSSLANRVLDGLDPFAAVRGKTFEGDVKVVHYAVVLRDGKYADAAVSLKAGARGPSVSATVQGLSVDANLSLLGVSKDLSVSADSITLSGDMELSVVDGALKVAMPNAGLQVQGFKLDTDNLSLPCCADAILSTVMRPLIESIVTGALRDRLPNALALTVGSSRVDLQACKLEYSIVSPK